MYKTLSFIFIFFCGLASFESSFAADQSTSETAKEILKKMKTAVKDNNGKFEQYSKYMEGYKQALADVKKYGLAMQKVKLEIIANKSYLDNLMNSLDMHHSTDYASKRDANDLLNEHKYKDYESLLRYGYAAEFSKTCHYLKPMGGYFPDPQSLHVRNFFDLPRTAEERSE